MIDGTAGAMMKYASVVFAHRMAIKDVSRHYDAAHRSMVHSCGRLYRTVSCIDITGIRQIKYDVVIRALITAKKKK